MDTKQKLTLGIAAIFMVTLTIVGVTYAYFVTQVTTETPAAVNVSTANVGSVEYQVGNGASDTVTLTDVLPGKTVYKSFKVVNTSKAANAASTYNVFLTSTTTEGKAHYIHAVTDTDCYTSAVKQSNVDGATTTCFDGTAYNNVYVTLYKVDAATFAKVDANGAMSDTTGLTDVKKAETRLAATAGVAAGTADMPLINDATIISNTDGNATDYYIAKVEYKSVDKNQNLENNAALSIKFSIR